MKNRNKLRISYLIIAALFVFSCENQKRTEIINSERTNPNILFIAIDDLRPELQVYIASHIKSPAIDQLASQSLVFDRAYCNIPVCGTANLLSGIRPGRHRFIGYSTYLDEDYPGVTSLPKHFKNNGYTTISNGKITDKTIQDLKELKEKRESFFMAVGFIKPHLPFNAPAKYWDLYDSPKISLPENYLQSETTPKEAFHNSVELRHYSGVPKKGPVSEELANKLIHSYYASVSYTDAQIGKILAALQELELDENTVIILWGDHGWNLGDHQLWCKHCNFESSLHVPLMLKVPGQTSGKHTTALAEYIDIYPSLSELAGLSIPEHTDGESFVPLINGMNRSKDFAISKFNDGITLVKGELFYTEWLDKEDNVKAKMLFDHSKDPLELNNFAESPEFAEKSKGVKYIPT